MCIIATFDEIPTTPVIIKAYYYAEKDDFKHDYWYFPDDADDDPGEDTDAGAAENADDDTVEEAT